MARAQLRGVRERISPESLYAIFREWTATEKENWNGLTLAEIKKRYRAEATQAVLASEVQLADKEVSDGAFKTIVFSLMKSGSVAETVEDRYIVEKSVVNPRWQRAATQVLISSEIIVLLLAGETGRGLH